MIYRSCDFQIHFIDDEIKLHVIMNHGAGDISKRVYSILHVLGHARLVETFVY